MGVSTVLPSPKDQPRVKGTLSSVLSSELRQHLCLWVRAEDGLSHPASPVQPPPGPDHVPLRYHKRCSFLLLLLGAGVGGCACWSRSLSWPRQCCVDGLFPVRRAVRLGYVGGVSYGVVQGPLGRAHVREGGVQP